MSFDFDFLPDEPDKLQSAGASVTPGRGMAIITAFTMYGAGYGSNKGTQHELELEIVAWTDPNCVAGVHKEGIWHADKEAEGSDKKKQYAQTIAIIVCAAGVLTLPAIKKMSMNQIDNDQFYAKLAGRPVMIEIAARAKKDDPTKVYHNIAQYGRAIYHIKDPRVADRTKWPVHQTIYNRLAATVGEWGTGAKPAASAPAAAKPAAAGTTINPFAEE